jgi:hypothetical protein
MIVVANWKTFMKTRMAEARRGEGQWLAYASDENGRDEVYVAQFPGPGERVQMSTDGGTGPIWSHDGRNFFYRSTDGRFVSVDVTPGARLGLSNRASQARALSARFRAPRLPNSGLGFRIWLPVGAIQHSI